MTINEVSFFIKIIIIGLCIIILTLALILL